MDPKASWPNGDWACLAAATRGSLGWELWEAGHSRDIFHTMGKLRWPASVPARTSFYIDQDSEKV